MADERLLRLDLVDVYGVPLNERVEIILRHQELSETVKVNRLVKGPHIGEKNNDGKIGRCSERNG